MVNSISNTNGGSSFFEPSREVAELVAELGLPKKGHFAPNEIIFAITGGKVSTVEELTAKHLDNIGQYKNSLNMLVQDIDLNQRNPDVQTDDDKFINYLYGIGTELELVLAPNWPEEYLIKENPKKLNDFSQQAKTHLEKLNNISKTMATSEKGDVTPEVVEEVGKYVTHNGGIEELLDVFNKGTLISEEFSKVIKDEYYKHPSDSDAARRDDDKEEAFVAFDNINESIV